MYLINHNDVFNNKKLIAKLSEAKQKLNALEVVDYEEVAKIKYQILDEVYTLIGEKSLASKGFKDFYTKHQHWLEPYAAFCYCRDAYGTIDFNQWPAHTSYSEKAFKNLTKSDAAVKAVIEKYYFIQYMGVQIRKTFFLE